MLSPATQSYRWDCRGPERDKGLAQGRTASALSFIFCKLFHELALLPQEPSGWTEYHKPTFPVSQLKNRAGRGEARHPPAQFTSFHCAPAGCKPLPGASLCQVLGMRSGRVRRGPCPAGGHSTGAGPV